MRNGVLLFLGHYGSFWLIMGRFRSFWLIPCFISTTDCLSFCSLFLVNERSLKRFICGGNTYHFENKKRKKNVKMLYLFRGLYTTLIANMKYYCDDLSTQK